jgi:hypothetical protein
MPVVKRKGEPTQPATYSEPAYRPGVKGKYISNAELVAWWRSCAVEGQPPTLELGDHWFIDPPMLWEASGEAVLTRYLHVLPPQMWHRLN